MCDLICDGNIVLQVGLVDVMRAVDIMPDGFVGVSVGELGCSYLDGCLTAEQTVLAAYWCGRALKETELSKGMMAAVGESATICIYQNGCKFHYLYLLSRP